MELITRDDWNSLVFPVDMEDYTSVSYDDNIKILEMSMVNIIVGDTVVYPDYSLIDSYFYEDLTQINKIDIKYVQLSHNPPTYFSNNGCSFSDAGDIQYVNFEYLLFNGRLLMIRDIRLKVKDNSYFKGRYKYLFGDLFDTYQPKVENIIKEQGIIRKFNVQIEESQSIIDKIKFSDGYNLDLKDSIIKQTEERIEYLKKLKAIEINNLDTLIPIFEDGEIAD